MYLCIVYICFCLCEFLFKSCVSKYHKPVEDPNSVYLCIYIPFLCGSLTLRCLLEDPCDAPSQETRFVWLPRSSNCKHFLATSYMFSKL